MLLLQAPAQQVGAHTATPLGARDSIRVLNGARDAQAEFERTRRFHLPRGYASASEPCDAYVGRFCYLSGGDESDVPPPESPRTIAAREKLLLRLASAGVELPGDAWIIGQRVRYLAEAGRLEGALAAATECQAEVYWCAALAGYSLQLASDYGAADSAFNRALAAMPDDKRCDWLDIGPLLQGDLADRYDHLECAGRDSLAERVWWLARPLLLTDANDLRTEYLARETRTRIEQNSELTHTMNWADDVHDLTVRYGWSTWFSKQEPSPGSISGRPSVIGHEPSPSFNFMPSDRAVESPWASSAGDWDLDDRRAAARYAPTYARAFRPLEHQLAVFRRGDSALVVAAFDIDTGTAPTAELSGSADNSWVETDASPEARTAEPLTQTGLFASTGPRTVYATSTDTAVQTINAHDSETRYTHVLTLSAPWQPMLVSVEALVHDTAFRSRYGVELSAPTNRLALSDILLYSPGGTSPMNLMQALPLALPSTEVSRRRTLGLFWETYGLASDGEVLSVSLTVGRDGVSWFRRAAQALHLAGTAAPLRVRWKEVPERGSGVAARGVSVDLSGLPPGHYRVELTVTPRNEPPLSRTREIDVFD